MPQQQLFIIRTPGIFGRRYVLASNVTVALFKIGVAEILAENTRRPAFREMADTIVWGDIR